MKKFLLNTIFFLIIISGLNAVLYLISKNIYLKDYIKYSLNYNSYLLSDSHGVPLNGFTEKYNIYNFSAGSDSYFDMKRKVDFLVKHAVVDTVYITVDNHTLSPYRERTNNLDRSIYYSAFESYNTYSEYIMDKYFKRSIVFLQPHTRTIIRRYFYIKIKNIFLRNYGNSDTGKVQMWVDYGKKEKLKMVRKRYQSQFPSQLNSIKLRNSLIEIVSTCKKNNITLIGIKYPLPSEYLQMMGNQNYGADEVLLSRNCEVLDYQNIFINNDDMFDNEDHLNPKGGKTFVNIVFNRN